MAKLPRQSILTAHVAFIFIVAVLFSIFFTITVKYTADRYLSVARSYDAYKVSDHLFQAVRSFGFERGRQNVVLNYKGDMAAMDNNISFYLKHRDRGEENVRLALQEIEALNLRIADSVMADLEQKRSQAELLRAKAAEQIKLGYSLREMSFFQEWFDAMSAYIASLEMLARNVFANIKLMDNNMIAYLRLELNSLALRDNAGPVCSYLAAALLSPEGFNTRKYEEIITRKALAENNLKIISAAANRLNDAGVTDAVHRFEIMYFHHFQQMIENVLRYLGGKADKPYTQEEFTASAVSGLEMISNIMDTVSVRTDNYLQDKRAQALQILVGTLVIVLVLITLIAYSVQNILNQVYFPIRQVTGTMYRLAKGDLSIEVPATDRNDEIGDLVYALDIFKQNQASLVELSESLEKRVESELKSRMKSEALLIQQSKMASMGEMITLITHQWKQPLNVISMIAQDIELQEESKSEPDKERMEDAEALIKQVEFMSQTCDIFSNFLKPAETAGKFELSATVRDTYNLLKPQLDKKSIEVSVSSGENLFLYGLKNEFIQVLLNLFVNARDALNEVPAGERRIEAECYKQENNAVLSIKDTGPGIKEGAADKIFEQHFSTKSDKGTGLGLYMSRLIIESRFSGTISARNTGEGAQFTISIPLDAV